MAEALSLVASIVAVLQLSGKIASYIGAAKDTKSDIVRIQTELSELEVILAALQDMIDRNPALKTLKRCGQCLSRCEEVMSDVVEKLEQSENMWKRIGGPLLWPLREKDMAKLLNAITQQKSTIALALAVDHMYRRVESHTTKLSSIANIVASSRNYSTEMRAEIALVRNTQRAESLKNVLRNIQSANMHSNFDAARAKIHPGTGKWFIEGEEFGLWLANRQDLLWLTGIRKFSDIMCRTTVMNVRNANPMLAGCGKTVLSSSIIQELKERQRFNQDIAIAYFFFDFNDREKQSPSNMLAALLAQLCSQIRLEDIPAGIEQKEPQDSEVLIQILHTISKKLSFTYIVLDALDESERELVLKAVCKLADAESGNLNILITSRKEHDIENGLSTLRRMKSIDIRNTVVDTDIALFVRESLRDDPKFKKQSLELKLQIETDLRNGAQGMFRWVELQMATLRECRTAHQVKQALKSLPETLDQTYDRILQKIPGKDMDYAKAALIWLACSERPLSLEELAEAIIVQPFVKTIDPEDRLSDPLEVLEICGSLVSLGQVEGRYSDGRYALGLRFRTVQLSHYSVKEYLMSERMRSKKETAMYVHAFHKAQQILAETCITYLLLDDIEVDTEFDYLIKLYPLLGYSAYYWHRHYVCAKVNDAVHLDKLAITLFEKRYSLFRSKTLGLSRNYLINIRLGLNSRSLIYASYYGLDAIVKNLIRNGVDIMHPDDHPNALVAASYNGNFSTVQLLLKEGANINAAYNFIGTPLAAAAFGGHEPLVRLLLDERASRAVGGHFGSALSAAAAHGHESLVRMLLQQYDDDINTVGGKCGTALTAAAYGGFCSTVELLLNEGADVNVVGGLYSTALGAAVCYPREMMVRLLLEKGANVNAGGRAGNILADAAHSGCYSLVQLLLRAGIDVNAMSYYRGTALTAAASCNYELVVQLLLDEGANIHIMGGNDGTVLAAAASCGNELLVRKLLNQGANINAICGGYGTALIAAAQGGHESVVRVLLNKGADISPVGYLYGTALTAAAFGGSQSIVELLLTKGANVNTVGGRNAGTALMAAVMCHRELLALQLLNAGADVNIIFGIHGTALAIAAYRGSLPLVRLLLQHGANINALCGEEGTALQSAVSVNTSHNGSRLELVRFLLASGADVNVAGGRYGSALQAALSNSENPIIRLLQEAGAVQLEVPTTSIPSGDVQAPLSFFLDLKDEHTPCASPYDTHIITIRDIRGHENALSLDTQGIAVHTLSCILAFADFTDVQKTTSIHYRPIADLLRTQFPTAKDALVFGHTIFSFYATYKVKLSQTPRSAEAQLRELAPERADEILANGTRYQIINVWWLLDPAVMLALADSSTVKEDEVVTAMSDTSAGFVEHAAGVRYGAQQKWWYFSCRWEGEVVLVKCFDSKAGYNGERMRVPHSLTVHPRATEGKCMEERSIEFRSLVIE